MKFTVIRNKWVNGTNSDTALTIKENCLVDKGSSQLLNVKRNMCCLGFCLLQIGYLEGEIYLKGTPAVALKRCTREDNIFATRLNVKGGNTDLTTSAITINDDPYTTEVYKEEALTKLFQEHGHEIEFV